MQLSDALDEFILDVPDFPQAGVMFKDITPLLGNAEAFAAVVAALAQAGRDEGRNVVVDKVVGIEARGFLFGTPVAQALGVGFVPVRKPGKLPRQTHEVSFALEYGEDTLEIHQDALGAGERVLIIDDVLATGGTLAAAAKLVDSCGAITTRAGVLLELSFLEGRDKTGDLPIVALRTLLAH